MQLGDDLAMNDLDRCEQRRRTVALVVMGHRAAAPWNERQRRLRSIEGLYLAFLVDTQDQRVVGWIEVEADDVDKLLFEPRIVAQLERADSVRLSAHSRSTHGAPSTE
jgi:hypothetical protein